MLIHIFYIKPKRSAIVFVFTGARGVYSDKRKRISGRLESTPKLIELKHFKKSNSSRNDTINAVEGSRDEMNQ